MDDNGLKVNIGIKREKGKSPVPVTITVPPDQVWMYYKLTEQEKLLGGIKTAVQIIAVIVLLTAILAACGALGLRV